jgi:hypothetical protein
MTALKKNADDIIVDSEIGQATIVRMIFFNDQGGDAG